MDVTNINVIGPRERSRRSYTFRFPVPLSLCGFEKRSSLVGNTTRNRGFSGRQPAEIRFPSFSLFNHHQILTLSHSTVRVFGHDRERESERAKELKTKNWLISPAPISRRAAALTLISKCQIQFHTWGANGRFPRF